MKKTLSMLSLVAIIGFAAPVTAAPPGNYGMPHPAPHGTPTRGLMGGIPVRYGHPTPMPMHRPPFYTAGFARRGYWRTPPYCNYTVRYINGYYSYPYYPEDYYGNNIFISVGTPFF